jgi:hypothetical protein
VAAAAAAAARYDNRLTSRALLPQLVQFEKSVGNAKQTMSDGTMLTAILCLVVLQSVCFSSTSAGGSVVNVKFDVVKADNGSDLCAMSQPTEEVSTRSVGSLTVKNELQ